MTREYKRHYDIQDHGLFKESRREYNSWLGARYRCTSSKHPKWADYGGRGISMCDRWANSFADFLADMGPRPAGAELDRIDNDGHYEPGNCRWIESHAADCANKSRPRKPQVARKPNAHERVRLARVKRIEQECADLTEFARKRIARLEAERDMKIAEVLGTVREQFHPPLA